MSAVAPDHDKLLRLFQIALIARDNHPLWKADVRAACRAHADACDEAWEEAERQVRLYLEAPK